MRWLVLVIGAAALACGSVNERPTCSSSLECPAGQWCAGASGQRSCAADTVAPSVTSVSTSCATAPCLRDGVLHVEASVIDDNEVLDASVSVDLDASRSFPMTRSGAGWVADVPLRQLPFAHFEHGVVATVVARDGARLTSAPRSATGVAVTRMRWDRAVDALGLTTPAVMADGSVVVGGTSGKVYFLGTDGTPAHAPLAVGTGQITAAPAIGQHAIWIGSEDGGLYALALDGSAVIANVGVNVGGPIRGSVAVAAGAASDVGFATCTKGDGTGWIGTASTTGGLFDTASGGDGFTSGPIVGTDGRVHGTTANGTNDATLRSFTLSDAPFALVSAWTALVGKGSQAPLAVDRAGAVVVPSDEATPPQLKKTTPGASPTTTVVGDLAAFARDTAVVLANGDTIIGDGSGAIHRFSSTGPVWTPAPTLGGGVRGPMVLSGTTAPFLVPTDAGTVYALRDDGTIEWQVTLPSASALRAGNIHTPPGQSGRILSYGYFASGNGRLCSLIVDGRLDPAAPWPKAFHDPRNTSHAGPQP